MGERLIDQSDRTRGYMHFKSGVTVLLVAGAFAAGCGGGDKQKSSAAPSPNAAQADATAKAAARTAVSELEACYVDSMNYGDCKPATRGVDLSDATATGYKLTAKSAAGNSFVIEKAKSGAITRTCTTKGEGGCPPSGAW
jgi:hypothetical protein